MKKRARKNPPKDAGKPRPGLAPISGRITTDEAPDPALQPLLQQIVTHLRAKDFPKLNTALAEAAAMAPDDVRVLHFQGLAHFEQRDAVTAFSYLKKALSKRPNDPALQHNMAAILISLGKFDKAEELLRSAIALKPDYAEAYHTMAPIVKFKADDPLIPLMEQGLKIPGLNQRDTTFYAFALAKACDDAGLYDRGWPALERGNAAMSQSYNPDRRDAAVEALLRIATRERLTELGQYGHPSRAPILVVSLPRSGTTLLESVISDHPQVFAAGELTALGSIGKMMGKNLETCAPQIGHAEVLNRITPQHIYAGGLGYLNAARQNATSWFDHFVDKLPDNSFNLGFAAALVPNARVVHIMRHPLDVMLSIYFQRFRSVQYSFRPADWPQYYSPQKVLRDTVNEHRFFITGNSVSEGPAGGKRRSNRTYEVDLQIKNYKPVITWISTNTGDARTQDVIDREAKKAQKIKEREERRRG